AALRIERKKRRENGVRREPGDVQVDDGHVDPFGCVSESLDCLHAILGNEYSVALLFQRQPPELTDHPLGLSQQDRGLGPAWLGDVWSGYLRRGLHASAGAVAD